MSAINTSYNKALLAYYALIILKVATDRAEGGSLLVSISGSLLVSGEA